MRTRNGRAWKRSRKETLKTPASNKNERKTRNENETMIIPSSKKTKKTFRQTMKSLEGYNTDDEMGYLESNQEFSTAMKEYVFNFLFVMFCVAQFCFVSWIEPFNTKVLQKQNHKMKQKHTKQYKQKV